MLCIKNEDIYYNGIVIVLLFVEIQHFNLIQLCLS